MTYYKGENRRSVDEKTELVNLIIEAIDRRAPPCLDETEQQWVKLAIQQQVKRAKLTAAIIEKSLGGLFLAGLLWVVMVFVEYFRNHAK